MLMEIDPSLPIAEPVSAETRHHQRPRRLRNRGGAARRSQGKRRSLHVWDHEDRQIGLRQVRGMRRC